MDKFAFLVHPRKSAKEDMAKVFKPLGWLSESFLRKIMLYFPPVAFKVKIKVNGKKETIGWIITVPMTGSQLMSLSTRRVALKKIQMAIDKAKNLGASIVGLGALTAPATHGGKDIVRKVNGIKITNGNALTAYITVKAIKEIATAKSLNLSSETVVVVGATGSVGSAVSMHLAKKWKNILLVGRNDKKLEELRGNIYDIVPSANICITKDLSQIKKGKIVIVLTSSASKESLIKPEWYAKNALIYDDTQPRETSEELQLLRPDLIIIDGGVVETLGIDYGIDIGFGTHKSLAYACLTETVSMAMDSRIEDHVGHVEFDWVSDEGIAFEKNAIFKLAPYTSFGIPIKL